MEHPVGNMGEMYLPNPSTTKSIFKQNKTGLSFPSPRLVA